MNILGIDQRSYHTIWAFNFNLFTDSRRLGSDSCRLDSDSCWLGFDSRWFEPIPAEPGRFDQNQVVLAKSDRINRWPKLSETGRKRPWIMLEQPKSALNEAQTS